VRNLVQYVQIGGERYRIVQETKTKGLRRNKIRGYRLQNYGRKGRGKKGWMNVVGGWKPTMNKMNKYVENMRQSKRRDH